MKWAWRIGRVAGIDVYVHATFLILLAWVAFGHYSWRRNPGDALHGLLFISTLFGIVLLHELGHCLAARRYGIRTRDIILLPIGGLARLERLPARPSQELVVALAGPAVNVVLALALWAVVGSAATLAEWRTVRLVGGDFLAKLVWVNVFMTVFNLVPAFPMDGGRVLRSLLALWLGNVRATRIAVDIGQALAFMFGTIGLFKMQVLWVLIAFFVWLGAENEGAFVKAKSVLAGVPIQQVMITDFRTLLPLDPLSRAVDHVLSGFQEDFPVVDQGRVVGVLTRADLLSALAQRGKEAPVEQVMQRHFHVAEPPEMAEAVFARLQEGGCPTVPVVQAGRLVGILNAENIGEFLMIHAALRGERPGRTAV
ncbi:MAG: site-2 protease family protein [Verrucomicrobia bacterium]|nr:site-2 protease family protein [Verrucomicrobiota bacterium]